MVAKDGAKKKSVKDGAKQSAKLSFKQQMLKAREEAIIQAVNKLLAEKGYEAMTVDEVAQEVGIAKPSLYKHFASKEQLACAAMVRAMQRAQAFVADVDAQLSALDKLKTVTEWVMRLKLVGEMPNLPSRNSELRGYLAADADYMGGLLEVSEVLGGWIEQAQQEGALSQKIPAIAVLYTIFARACDPVVEFLRESEVASDDEIIQMVMHTCFVGLASR